MLDVPPVFALRRQELPLGSYVLSVSGEVDAYTAPELENELDRLIRAGAVHVVVDLMDAPFLDSCGLAVLLAAACRIGRDRFAVTGVGLESKRVIEITGADRFLLVVERPGEDEAA
jgi:anti-sigma B factor antagonist